ncbi:MAG: ribonuclease H-like domain-containing protein [Candidatus Alcyoniella australis]|nr:ribonuclease H-like domain-containing protein [Candidatus Alcyoniella australis]
MTKLRERLEGVLGSSGRAPEQDKQRTISQLRQRIDELTGGRGMVQPQAMEPTTQRVDIQGLVPGRVVDTPCGPTFVAQYRYPMALTHGRLRLDRLFDVDPAMLALLGADPSLAALDPRRTLFFDTETTGLAGGTGTYAFLIGLGEFEGDEFVVTQLFMRDLNEEGASLHLLTQKLERAAFLVSFNGKTFDAPLLNTRLVLNRLPASLDDTPHLDLLHPSRRLFREQLPDCRLGTLEQYELGFERRGDVPGSMVPELYRSYLRSRDGRLVAKVFTHNVYDVLSLVTLTSHLAQLVAQADSSTLDPALILATARLLRDRGQIDRARRCFNLALERSSEADPHTASRARLEVALDLKRGGEHERAAEHFTILVDCGPFDPLPYEQLAIHLEHHANDYIRAEQLTQRALQFLRAGAFASRREYWIAAFEHRLSRLQRKLG